VSLKIAHISDIHLRNYKRHNEYKQVFENLYASLEEKKPNCTIFTGDLAHTKTQISPEFVQVCSDFLKKLAIVSRKLIIIPGNHDGNLSNLNRLDALSPIVESIDSNRIEYYKESGIYYLNLSNYFGEEQLDVNLVHFSCFDNKWPTKEDIKSEINIGLFHGLINEAILQNSVMIDKAYDLDYFMDKVDYLMCGDIHESQFLNKERTAAYAGSLIQQNYGETRRKGYLLWEIEDKTNHKVEFVELENVCPFYTLKLKDDLNISNRYRVKKNSRIRVFSRQLNVLEKQDIQNKLEKYYEPKEIAFVDEVNPHRQEVKIKGTKAKIGNLSDRKVQDFLIRKFLKSSELEKEKIDKIIELNRKYDVVARKDTDVLRNISYRIEKFNFSNICSFGEDNHVDFSKYPGVLGIFGKNAVGKSTLAVDSLLYTIFNKISKKGVVKNDLLINSKKDKCSGSVFVELDDTYYDIERETSVYLKGGKRKGKPIYQGKTEVNFSIVNDSEKINKNGIDRNDTDKKIRKIFGTPEDFMFTTVAPQWSLINFIDAGSTERQKIIARYFDIDIFEDKYRLANEDFKDIKAKLKKYDGNLEEELVNLQAEIEKYEELKGKNVDFNKKLETKKEKIVQKIDNAKEKIVNVFDFSFSISDISRQIKEKEKKLKSMQAQKKKNGELIREKNSINIEALNNKLDVLDKADSLLAGANNLERGCSCKHEENCPLERKIKDLRAESDILRKSIKMTREEIENEIDRYKSIKIPKEAYGFATLVSFEEEALIGLKKKKDAVSKNKKQIEKNKKYQKKVEELKIKLVEIEKDIKDTFNVINKIERELGIVEGKCELTKKELDKYNTLRNKFEIYENYLKCMSKDGISQLIIFNNFDIINNEMKKILNGTVPFEITLEANDNRDIEIYFNHTNGERRIIELCSGMEKSISAIVIRAALINITTLPRSNLFILDEAFGSLDSEYLDVISVILENLKQLFETIVVITHIDSLKDCVDYIIEVERDDEGLSRIS